MNRKNKCETPRHHEIIVVTRGDQIRNLILQHIPRASSEAMSATFTLAAVGVTCGSGGIVSKGRVDGYEEWPKHFVKSRGLAVTKAKP